MSISVPEFSVLFKKTYPLEISFMSFDGLEEMKHATQEICRNIASSSQKSSMTNGGGIEEYVSLAFESLTWALTGYLSSLNQGLPVFSEENMKKSISLLEKLFEHTPEQFFSYVDEWKTTVAETASSLYKENSSENFVIYKICDQFYLESEPAKRLLTSLKCMNEKESKI